MLDGDEWSTPHPGLLTPRKDLVPIEEEAGFEPMPLPVFESRTVHPLAGLYNDYVIPANLPYM